MGDFKAACIVSGIGNLVGVTKAGFDLVLYIDNRPEIFSAKTIAHHFPDTLCSDDLEILPVTGIDFNLIISSPPCAQVSSLGMKRQDRSELLYMPFEEFEFSQILDRVLSMPSDIYVIEYLKSLSMYIEVRLDGLLHRYTNVLYPWPEGYRIQIQILNTLDYGLFQHRERLFIFLSKKELDFVYNPPTMVHEEYSTKSGYLLENLQKLRDSGEHLLNDEMPNHTKKRIMGFDALKFGESYYGGQNNRRIDPNKPSPTITSHRTRHVHPYQPRVLNVRECACFQGFPLEFEFFDSESVNLDLIGKTISPTIISDISEQALKVLKNYKYLTDNRFE